MRFLYIIQGKPGRLEPASGLPGVRPAVWYWTLSPPTAMGVRPLTGPYETAAQAEAGAKEQNPNVDFELIKEWQGDPEKGAMWAMLDEAIDADDDWGGWPDWRARARALIGKPRDNEPDEEENAEGAPASG